VPKTDYLGDPNAPKPNSLVVGVTAFVQDDASRVLLIEREDGGQWALPGGGQKVGGSTPAAAVRETLEETGIEVHITGLVGIYSYTGHVIAYDDGEVRKEFSICFRAQQAGGELALEQPAGTCARFEPRTERTAVAGPQWARPGSLDPR
jgi:8-oxo-dGTP pyrophosphatase MutT (NUDIX family)